MKKIQKKRSNGEFKKNKGLKNGVSEQSRIPETGTDRLHLLTKKLLRTQQDERRRLSGILHDHIQPLIVGARMQVWDIQRRNDSSQIQKTAEKIEDILGQALESLRSLSVELSPSALQNNGVAGGMNWLRTYMVKQFDFKVTLSISGDIEPVQEENGFLIFEAAKELLLNAAKHADVSEAHVSLRRTKEDLIILIVSDQGKGFDTALIESPSEESATLGLFSIQERLSSIGGGMLIETEPVKGTKITLTVPAGKAKKKNDPQTINNNDADAHQKNRSNNFNIKKDMIGILIVDDHKVLRQGLRSLLQAEPDFHVLGDAESGQKGIEMAVALKPDVIIMDVNLGDIHGIEATHRIMEYRPETRIIGLSMHDDTIVADAMMKAGAVNYLTKDLPVETILKTIRESLK